MSEQHRVSAASKVTIIGAGVNLLLAIIKIVGGIWGRSHALVADGLHSFADLFTDALVLFAAKFGARSADLDHPYGHKRIETAATLFLALLLSAVGFGIAVDAGRGFWHASRDLPSGYVLWIVLLSIVANESLYHYTKQVGQRIQSQLIIANAWHHRSDAASSLVVLVGVSGALMGYPWLDTIAAMIVGLMIVYMGLKLGWSSVKELVDTGVSSDVLEEIRSTILSVPGVIALHQLRTRCMAEAILVDAHILVSPRLSVSEGHFIASKVHHLLKQTMKNIADVTIHVDPENDEVVPVNRNLPSREQLKSEVMAYLISAPGVHYLCDMRMHYLQGAIELEIILPLTLAEEGHSLPELQKHYQQALQPLADLAKVHVFFV